MYNPVTVSVDGEIEASVDRAFELIDFSSPGNALRERGFVFTEPEEGGPEHYTFHHPHMDDIVHQVRVIRKSDLKMYEFETTLKSAEPVGNFVKSKSFYTFTAIDGARCKLDVTESTWLSEGLDEEDLAAEVVMLTHALQNHVVRLTLHAVQGIEGATSF